jgi:rRNA processing protein Gar1
MSDVETVVKVEAVVNPVINLHNEVKTRLVCINDSVREKYIEAEVSAKIVERVGLIKTAISKVVELEKEVKKVKPDQVACDIEGKVVQEYYSKDVAAKLKETKEKIAKLEAAITKAFEKADYSDLEKTCK